MGRRCKPAALCIYKQDKRASVESGSIPNVGTDGDDLRGTSSDADAFGAIEYGVDRVTDIGIVSEYVSERGGGERDRVFAFELHRHRIVTVHPRRPLIHG